ncbi:hypothetical protein [Brasilonema bromeliae]|uniref:Transposase n=1 Tax=Brasilonema bromeliae SPC951 TaxID=385972 RepID=A0ABX1PAL3_9CYAN|nr:hypothetical protein [Brasilonema bromeliae]NMG21493.1 hypothetical protein [Brasilonema bromeliae SPC951]
MNPIERFWEFLKSKLRSENCKTLAQLREKLAEALETITPEVIVSLTSYDFILEALFSAAS